MLNNTINRLLTFCTILIMCVMVGGCGPVRPQVQTRWVPVQGGTANSQHFHQSRAQCLALASQYAANVMPQYQEPTKEYTCTALFGNVTCRSGPSGPYAAIGNAIGEMSRRGLYDDRKNDVMVDAFSSCMIGNGYRMKSYDPQSHKDGNPDGLHTEWYENGQKSYEDTWKAGMRVGLSTAWYEDGQKKSETTFKEGKQDGLTTAWYKNGQKNYEGTWKAGMRVGLETSWHSNGQKKVKGTWKDGKPDGLYTVWDEQGNIIKQGTYKNGEAVQ